MSFEEKSRVNFTESCGCSVPSMGHRDQKGVKRKGEVERVSWRRWASSQALENEKTQGKGSWSPVRHTADPEWRGLLP